MRLDLTITEWKWIADLVQKDRIESDLMNQTNPHPLFELRRDNMADLENKINNAIQRYIDKGRNDAR